MIQQSRLRKERRGGVRDSRLYTASISGFCHPSPLPPHNKHHQRCVRRAAQSDRQHILVIAIINHPEERELRSRVNIRFCSPTHWNIDVSQAVCVRRTGERSKSDISSQGRNSYFKLIMPIIYTYLWCGPPHHSHHNIYLVRTGGEPLSLLLLEDWSSTSLSELYAVPTQ